jgi:hypothetical protein
MVQLRLNSVSTNQHSWFRRFDLARSRHSSVIGVDVETPIAKAPIPDPRTQRKEPATLQRPAFAEQWLQPNPDPLAPAADMTAAMPPVAAANPSPAAPPSTTTPMAVVTAMMSAAMGDLLHFDPVIAFEDSLIRLVQFIENSVALGNTGNRAARADYARKRDSPRNAKQSSKKQPTFHQNLPSC